MLFSDAVLRVLSQAGWQEGRSVDPAPYIAELQACELGAHDAAIRFYRTFGGLRVRPAHSGVIDFTTESFWCGSDEPLDALARSVGLLCPIGHESHSDLELRIDPSGRIYGYNGSCRWLFHVGDSPEAAIENMLTTYDFKRIRSTS